MAEAFITRRGSGGGAALPEAVAGQGIPIVYFSALGGSAIYSFTNTTYAIAPGSAVTTNVAGSIRIVFALRRSSGTGTVYARIYKNGVAAGTERSSNTATLQRFTEDFSFAAGDVFSIYVRSSASASAGRLDYVTYEFNDVLNFISGIFAYFSDMYSL